MAGRKFGIALALVAGLMAAGCGADYQLAPLSAKSAFGTSVAAQTGAVQIQIRNPYQTQATLAQVKFVAFTLEGANVPKKSQTLAFTNQTVSFTDLPAGPLTLTVEAQDEAKMSLGSTSQTLTIEPGKITHAPVQITLAPELAGGISIDLSIVESGTVPAPTPTPTPVVTPTPAPTTAPGLPPAQSFQDGFDSLWGLDNWTTSYTKGAYSTVETPTSNWNLSGASAKGGSYGVTPGGQQGQVADPGSYVMTLKTAIDGSRFASPTLRFDVRNFFPSSYFKSSTFAVEASTNGWNWTKVYELTTETRDWKAVEVNLDQFKAAGLKIRFVFGYSTLFSGATPLDAPHLDNVYLGEK
jgi:hypothetical protein